MQAENKPIYKNKWFLIGGAVMAFVFLTIVTNLCESEEPAPVQTATPVPTRTPIPTPTQVPLVLSDDTVGDAFAAQEGWYPKDIAFERFCSQATQGEDFDIVSGRISNAIVILAVNEGWTGKEAQSAVLTWCQNR